MVLAVIFALGTLMPSAVSGNHQPFSVSPNSFDVSAPLFEPVTQIVTVIWDFVDPPSDHDLYVLTIDDGDAGAAVSITVSPESETAPSGGGVHVFTVTFVNSDVACSDSVQVLGQGNLGIQFVTFDEEEGTFDPSSEPFQPGTDITVTVPACGGGE